MVSEESNYERSDFFEDLHGLVKETFDVLERVYLTGDGNAMPTIEANAVARDAAIKSAGEDVMTGLTHVAQALGLIAQEMRETRVQRERMGK